MYQLIHFCIKVYLFSFNSKTKNAKETFYNHYNHFISISPSKRTLPIREKGNLVQKFQYVFHLIPLLSISAYKFYLKIGQLKYK